MEPWGLYLVLMLGLWLAYVLISDLFLPYLLPSISPMPAKFLATISTFKYHEKWLKAARVPFRRLTNGMSILLDGYHQHSRNGRSFTVCDPSLQQELMLSPEHIKWFSGQPDSKMSSRTIREERHAVGYLHVGVEFDSTLFFLERIIRDSLTRNLDAIQEPMCEEIRRGFDQVFGADDAASAEWTTISVYDSLQKLILPVMTRVFFGLPLSRDPSFLKSFERYILAMGVGTIVIGQLPKFFKRLFVPIFNLPLRYYRRKTLNKLVPEVERQLSGENTGNQGESFISQCARISESSAMLESAKNPHVLAEWLMLAGFAAMSSTVIQISNSVLDILNCDSDLDLCQALRSEAESVLKTENDWKRSATFNGLILHDSVIRESLRCHPILIKGLTKEVTNPEGLELPDGAHLPKGSWVGVPVLGVHRDERFYPDPATYDPYRFVKLRQGSDQKATANRASAHELDAARPSPVYLGFGYGRHACPGRWFAVLMIKTILAHLTIHYSVEATGPQPKMSVIGDAALPPLSSTIRVRRRKRMSS